MPFLSEEQYERARDLFFTGLTSRQVYEEMLYVTVNEVRRALCSSSYSAYRKTVFVIDTDPRERGGTRKLTAEDVREIHLLRGIMSGIQIALKYDVDPSNISYILTGRSWRHLHPNYEANKGKNRPAD